MVMKICFQGVQASSARQAETDALLVAACVDLVDTIVRVVPRRARSAVILSAAECGASHGKIL